MSRQGKDSGVIYEGPFAKSIVRLKKFSIGSSFCSLFSPLLLTSANNSSIPLHAQLTLIGSVLLASFGSTLMINWFTKPYVVKIKVIENTASMAAETTTKPTKSTTTSTKDGKQEIKQEDNRENKQEDIYFEQYNLFARPVAYKLNPSTVKKVDGLHPYINYQASGRNLFIHPEVLEKLKDHRLESFWNQKN